MQWSKLKTGMRELICPELKDRIDFHLTSYRKSHDGADKIWITVDGQTIFSCRHYPYEFEEAKLLQSNSMSLEQVKAELNRDEIYKPNEFGDAISVYPGMPVREALHSSNPFIKAFAIIDRRTGKRTIQKLEISDSEHTLVKAFYNLRVSLPLK